VTRVVHVEGHGNYGPRGMSLPRGRRDARVRSCGRARKRDDARRPLGKRGGSEDVASIISGLLSQDRTEGSGVMVNGRKHRLEEKACQSNTLGCQLKERIGSFTPIEISKDD
jgi:hypothetical protein